MVSNTSTHFLIYSRLFPGRRNNNKRVQAVYGNYPDRAAFHMQPQCIFDIRHGFLEVKVLKREHLDGNLVRGLSYLGIDKLLGNLGQRDYPVKPAFFNIAYAVQPE